MVVFSNHRIGPAAELLVSDDVARALLRATADAARPFASGRWEVELVRWLDVRAEATAAPSIAEALPLAIDVGEIAWTPDHFERQRRFLIDAMLRAAALAEHAVAFDRWRRMVEAHPADSVQVGRRWRWQPAAQ